MRQKDHEQLKKTFSRLLLKWHHNKNTRQMPWKGEKDPYRIWLSEIILQQTRVDQGLQYYQNFVKAFPTIQLLAASNDERIFKHWEGLGYYSRCRNLIATARYIANEQQGLFPSNYDELLALKGIGPYTAAAIGSFAFGLPYAVVDGNVFRVLSRVFGIDKPIDSTDGKKYFNALAQELLDKKQPGQHNQAIMDFGAVICKPATPLCAECMLNKYCQAYNHDRVNELPLKEKKTRIRNRWFYYLLLEHKHETAILQRTAKDIWQDLYEFPLVDSTSPLTQKAIVRLAEKKELIVPGKYRIQSLSPQLKHQLSHQLIVGQFIEVNVQKKPRHSNWLWIQKDKLHTYTFPRFITRYLGQLHNTKFNSHHQGR